MMKRTIEIVITVIGMVLYILPVFIGFLGMAADESRQARQEFEAAFAELQMAQNGTMFNVEDFFSVLNTLSLIILLSGIVAIVLGILASVFLKGDKKPKAAGIILIVTAIVTTFTTIGFGLFGGVAFLIAGIVALARRSKKPVSDPI